MNDNWGDDGTGTHVESLGQSLPTHDLESPERATAVKTVELAEYWAALSVQWKQRPPVGTTTH